MKGFCKVILDNGRGSISSLLMEAVKVASLLDTRVEFVFNGVTVCINKNTNIFDVIPKVLDAVKDNVNKVYG